MALISGVRVESDLPLPELLRGPGPAARLRVRSGGPLRSRAHDEAAEGEWVSAEPLPGGVRLHFGAYVSFDVHDGGRDVVVRAAPGTSAATVRHFLLDHVVPRCLGLQGDLVLHAGAVVAAGSAVALLGASTTGKSTMVAGLGRLGLPVLADDGLRLEAVGERLVAHPGYPGLRLWPDMAAALFGADASFDPMAEFTEKVRVPGNVGGVHFAEEAAPLALCAVLVPLPEGASDSEVELVEVTRAEALPLLVEHSFRLDLGTPADFHEEFDRLAASPLLTRFVRLRHPRRLTALPRVRGVLEAAVAGLDAPPDAPPP